MGKQPEKEHSKTGPKWSNLSDKAFCKMIHCISESVGGKTVGRKQPLKCNICGKKLKKKAVLTVHLAREHGIGEEPFKCFVCSQGAAFEKAMRLHLESHLPYKLYRCSSCGVRFSNRRSLASHELHEKCFTSSRRPSES